MIVTDASVAVKWFLPEEGSDRAMVLLAGQEMMIAPDIIRTEVASAFTRRARMGGISHDEARSCIGMWLEALREGIVQVSGDLDDLREASNLALQLSHPVQDCLYLALARRRTAKLITADRKFAEKASSVFPAVLVL